MGVIDKKLEDAFKSRLSEAENKRNEFAKSYNDFYEFASPHRKRVGKKSNKASNPDEQNEIFDTTLQDNADDFQSDMLDLFTPRYRDWTEFEPADQLTAGQKREVGEQITDLQRFVFGEIRNSNFYEAAQEMWADIGVGCGAIHIPNAPAGDAVSCSIVQAADLLIEVGPNGIDGRWRELNVKLAHLETEFPKVDWKPYLKKNPIAADTANAKTVPIVEGFHRNFEKRGEEVWIWSVTAAGEVVHWEEVTGSGAPTVIPIRWRVAAPSPWGAGPFPKALPPARTLNELHYLLLKWLGKIVDPPFTYDQDTVFNPEGGLDAGMGYPRLPGTKIDFLTSKQDLRSAIFEQEDLRSAIRRALYQDKPFQRGDTPPTATQWLDEKAVNNRRLELPRERINRELVLAVIERFLWILAERGSLPKVTLKNSQVIKVVPQSPLSKASDTEDVNTAAQVMQLARGFFPQTSETAINATKTLANIKLKLNDKLVELRTENEAAKLQAAQALAGNAPSGGGSPGGGTI